MNNDRQGILEKSLTGSDLTWTYLTRAILVVVAVLAYVRLFIGVDVTDESFYNAMPYSFSLGFRPYLDELNITQNSGILLAPLYRLFSAMTGSSAGLVLFNRHLYFLLLLGCSYLTFRVGTGYVGRSYSRLLAAFVLTFSYFNIPSLSYNTLGALFLFGGLFQLLLCVGPDTCVRPHRFIFAANMSFVLSAFCYPTLLLSSIIGFGVSLWLSIQPIPSGSARQAWDGRIAWGLSFALGLAGAIVFLACYGFHAIADSLAYADSYGHNPIGSAPQMTFVILGQLRDLGLYFAAFTVLLVWPIIPARTFRDYHSSFIVAGFAGSVGLLFMIHRQPSLAAYPAGSVPLLLCFGLLAPGVLCLLPDRRKAREFAIIVCMPSFAAALAVAFSSGNGLSSAILGLFPAAVCGLLTVAMIARAIDLDRQSNGVRAVSVLVTLVPILGFQGYSLLERSYRDAPFSGGALPVFATGPFAGLLTTEANARRLAALEADLNSLGNSAQTLFIYDRFPAGYLLSHLKPRTFSTWIFWPADPAVETDLLRRVFASAEASPDVLLQIGPSLPWIDVEVRRLKYRVHVERPEFGYVILLRERI